MWVDVISTETICAGIFQGDIVVQTAIQEGFERLRKDDWLVDFCFASLAQDPLTVKRYGQQQIDEAKRWVRSVEVPVFTNSVLPPKVPAITIALAESSEVESQATLADVHHEPTEPLSRDEPLSPPFEPRSWDPARGVMVLPEHVADRVNLATGMAVADAAGDRHEIVEVIDDATVRLLVDGAVVDFRPATLRPALPDFAVHLKSSQFRETFTLGCHASGPPLNLLFLHHALVFVLLRYKRTLFELRGFERTTFSSSDFARNQAFEGEVAYARYVTLTGYARFGWPDEVAKTIQSTDARVRVAGLEHAADVSLVLGTEDAFPS